MTGKLIKYEFRSIVKLMGIVWTALPVMALVTGFFGKVSFGDSDYAHTPFFAEIIGVTSAFLFGGIFIAMIAVTVLVVLLRFYKGLLRDEGYLMHTLPVKTWQLITAKGVVAVCVTLISMVVAVLSILLLTVFEGGLAAFGEFMGQVFRSYRLTPSYIPITLEILALTVLYTMGSIYRAYASMAIGQLAKRHKIVLSVAAYLGIGVAGMILLITAGNVLSLDIFDPFISIAFGWMDTLSAISAVQTVMIFFIVLAVIQIAVFHIITEQLLRKKLNLE